ncbi:MAG TPA: hypothetical protein VKZ46_03150 [Pedomonas sp.]|nr:hypothetical protein [Pedomonas sp.]
MQPPKQRPPGAPPPQDHPDHPDQMGQRAPEPPPADVRPGSTSAQLKHDINSGLTGDKVNYFDPAAAPLGTDEEAGGSPPTPEEVHQARMAERSAPMDSPGADSRTPQGHGEASDQDIWSERTAAGGASRWTGYLIALAAIALLIYLLAS